MSEPKGEIFGELAPELEVDGVDCAFAVAGEAVVLGAAAVAEAEGAGVCPPAVPAGVAVAAPDDVGPVAPPGVVLALAADVPPAIAVLTSEAVE
jgi:hypothetical protein